MQYLGLISTVSRCTKSWIDVPCVCAYVGDSLLPQIQGSNICIRTLYAKYEYLSRPGTLTRSHAHCLGNLYVILHGPHRRRCFEGKSSDLSFEVWRFLCRASPAHGSESFHRSCISLGVKWSAFAHSVHATPRTTTWWKKRDVMLICCYRVMPRQIVMMQVHVRSSGITPFASWMRASVLFGYVVVGAPQSLPVVLQAGANWLETVQMCCSCRAYRVWLKGTFPATQLEDWQGAKTKHHFAGAQQTHPTH
jgi:hypothetical protein